MRRLIFAWSYLDWGGAQIYSLAIMKEAMRDWDVTVVLPSGSLPEVLSYLEDIGVSYEFVDACSDNSPAPTIGRKVVRQWRRIRAQIQMFRHLRQYNLRRCILHIELAPWQDWVFLTMLVLRGANVFVTVHNAPPRFPAWRRPIWWARLQFISRLPGFRIFTANRDARSKLEGLVAEDFREKLQVTHAGINPPEIDAVVAEDIDVAELRRQFGLGETDFIVLTVGQFIDRKGRWTMLDAARKVVERDDEISFVWVLPRTPDKDDMAKFDGYCLGDRFRLLLSGTVGKTRHEVLRFFRLADAFALPSFIEGLPIALMEAMALGLPSVSTNVYAIPEAIKHRETGLLIEAGDSDALAGAILELKNSAKLRRHLSIRGRDYVIANFDEREASRIALAAYEECFADGR